MGPNDYLHIAGVTKRFQRTAVLDDLTLDVAEGEFVSLLGPSGCGKTTLLRILAGLLAADAGTVRLAGRDLGRLPPHRRNIGVVFQNYALFPHLSVADNIAFGLRARGAAKADIADAVRRALDMIRLPHLADRMVTQLSGGQQQRVAVARALAVNPALILLDEPLSALDRKMRETMQVELRRLLRELGMTAIFVTHDQEEALALSDRIAVMNAGRIEQLGSPQAIYGQPASAFVLDFVGLSSIFAGEVVGEANGRIAVRTQAGLLQAPGRFLPGSRVTVAVRPESIELGAPAGADWTGIALPLADRTFLGARCLLHGAAEGDDRAMIETSAAAGAELPIGGEVAARWRVADAMVFPPTMMARWRGIGMLSLPATFYYVAIFALPIAVLLTDSFRGADGWTVAGYVRFFASAYNWQVIWRTLRLALLCTLVCVVIGYPAAFALAATRGKLQSLLIAVLLLPLSVSVIVKAFGWTVLLRSNGLVNQTLRLVGLTDAPLRLLFTETGLLLGISNIFLPFLVLPLFSVVRQFDPRLSDAAATLGGGPLYRFLHVTLPLTLPGLIAGITLVFSLSIAAYVIPTLLMGDTYQTLPTAIATSFLYLQDNQKGSVAGVTLLVLSVVVIVGGVRLGRKFQSGAAR